MATIIKIPKPFKQQHPKRTVNLIALAEAMDLVESAGYDFTVPPGYCEVCGGETESGDSVCPDCENWVFGPLE